MVTLKVFQMRLRGFTKKEPLETSIKWSWSFWNKVNDLKYQFKSRWSSNCIIWRLNNSWNLWRIPYESKNPRNCKIFIFKPYCHFGGKTTKTITRMNSQILTNSYMILPFSENGHSDNDDCLEKNKKSYVGWICKNTEINACYSFCDFPSKIKI